MSIWARKQNNLLRELRGREEARWCYRTMGKAGRKLMELVHNDLSWCKSQGGPSVAESWVSVGTGMLRLKEVVERTCLGYWRGEHLQARIWKSNLWWKRLKQIDGGEQRARHVGKRTSYLKAGRPACRLCLRSLGFTSMLCSSKCTPRNFLMVAVAGSCHFPLGRRHSSDYFLVQSWVSGAEAWSRAFSW